VLYATPWIALHEVARHVGVTERSLTLVAVLVEQRRLKTDGTDPPHRRQPDPFLVIVLPLA
jgi:hypothetical protein